MASAVCAGLAVGFAVFIVLGRGERAVFVATQSTARVAFIFFWLAYTGGALATFFGPAFDGLARHGRAFGLAFAAALLVHLAFVAWLFRISASPPLSDTLIFFFAVGALCTCALALASVERVRDLLGATAWRIFSAAALEYVAFLFFHDFILLPLRYGAGHPLFYVPFSILIIVGPLLRWGAMLRRRYLAG